MVTTRKLEGYNPLIMPRKPITEPPVKAPRMGRPSTRVEVACVGCGSTFEALPSEIKRGGGRYCNATCRDRANGREAAAREVELPRRPTEDVACSTCGGTFKVYPGRAGGARLARFCSRRCYKDRPFDPRLGLRI